MEQIYMVVCDAEGGGTDYFAVAASSEEEAIQKVAEDDNQRKNIACLNGSFISNLHDQYGGVAMLCGGF